MLNVSYLMPRNFRFVGIFFFITGAILGIARFIYGFKPDFLDFKLFAVYSEYLESKFLQIISNNMCEEFSALFLITGLFLIAFSKEKSEEQVLNTLRLKAFFVASYLNLLFLIAAIFFTFGFAFVYMLMANMIVFLAAYISAFRIMYLKYKSKGQP